MKRVKQIVMMAFASLLAQCVWAAVKVGDTVTWSNVSNDGTLATEAWNACQYSLCLTAKEGLPNGAVVKIKSITFASWNDSFVMWDATNKKSDIHWLKLNGVDSDRVNGADTSTNYQNVPMTETLALCGETPKALKFNFSQNCEIVVGKTYAQPSGTSASGVGQGMTLRHQNGNANASSGVGYSSVRHINSIGVVGNSAAGAGYSPAAIVVAEVVDLNPADFVFKGSDGAGTLTGDKTWVNNLLQSGNEGGDVAGKMYGPNGIVNMAYDSDNGNITGSKWHPWYGAASKNAFTIAAYLNIEAVKVAADTHAILISLGNKGGRKIVLAKEPDGSVALIAANGGTIQNASTMPKIAASKVAKGWHLYTFTFSTTDGLTLAVDGEDPIADSCDGAKVATAAGFQIGSIYQGRPDVFKLPDFLGVAMVSGWTNVISAADRAKLVTEYPVQSSIKADVDLNTSGKILVLPSATSDGNHFIGVTNGALTIPADTTVEVPHVRCLNSASEDNRATVNIAGTVNVTSESSNPNVWADRLSYKGVLFGHYHGQGTYNITGTLNAPNTYVELCYTAEAQTLNVNGGTLTTKGIHTQNGQGTINLSNDGRIELSTSTFMNVPVTVTGGTIAAGESTTYAKQLTVSSGELALEVGAGKTLTLNGGVTNNGTISVKTGTVVIPAGSEGTVAVTDGATLKLRVTDAQVAAGYTASGVTLAEGQNITFILPDNTEETGSGNKLVAAAPTWTGDAGDGSWNTAGNWSTGVVPTADTAATFEKEATVNVTSSSICKQLVVGANVTLVGQIAANAMPNIVIGNNSILTVNATSESTLNGVSGGTLVKDGSATLNLKAGTGTDVSVLANMAVVIKNGKILINQPTGTEAKFHDVAFTIEASACGNDNIPLDCYGWFSVTGPWSITTTGNARVFNNNNYGNAAVVKGSGNFAKLGEGTVEFLSAIGNADNAYSGTVTVSAGTLKLAARTEDFTNNISGKYTVASAATLTIDSNAKFTHNGASDTSDIAGILNVNRGTTTMKGSDRGFRGTLNVAKGATMKLDRSDFFTYNNDASSVKVNVKGTLDFQTYRQTLRETVAFNFYSGCTVQGYGDNNANWPCAMEFWNADHTEDVKFLKADDDETGIVTFNTSIGLENNTTFDIADGVTVVCGSATSGENTRNLVNRAADGKSITKAGAGTLKIDTVYTTATFLAGGTLQVATAETMPTVTSADVSKKVATKTVEGKTVYGLVEKNPEPIKPEEGTETFPEGTVITKPDGTVVSGSTLPTTTGIYTVQAMENGFPVGDPLSYGVVNVEKTTVSTTHAVAVPFKGKTVATLLNTALLAEGDTLMAWVNGNYEVWTLQADKTWKQQPITRAGEQNSEGIDPANAALKCGQGVWVTTAGQIVTFGDMNATGDTVELEEGHNLLGNTSLEDATPTVAATADQVQLIGEVDAEGNEIITRYNKTSTGWESKIQTRTQLGNGKWVTTETTSNVAPTVKPGRGYWLIRK